MSEQRTLREQLEGYQQYNTWERDEQRAILQKLTVTESLTQFFELCALAATLAPESDARFLEEKSIHWRAMHERLRQLAEWRHHGTTTRSTT